VVRVTRLYTRPGSRVPIHWNPEDKATGKTAIESVLGSSPDSYPVEVDAETAEQIRQEYERLIGGSN
jgi:glycosidase